jgi:hypothetical protein
MSKTFTARRNIVIARQQLQELIQADLIPLEKIAHHSAAASAKFSGLLLDCHSEAGLGLSDGNEVIRLSNEAAHAAIQFRSKLADLHQAARAEAERLGMAIASGPDCPPNEPGDSAVLPFMSNDA